VRNGLGGVIIVASSGNTVGGTATGAGNLISGNTDIGILIFNGATANLVQGNQIGTNAAGTAALSNAAGVLIRASSGNTVGGTATGAGNLISGNDLDGILIDAGATANLVQGNQIGTNAAGSAAVANGGSGIDIEGSASNTIGGKGAGAGNLISGNGGDGIDIVFGATANVVQGNKIGTDATGTTAVGNLGDGVHIGTSSNTIGGMVAGAGNLISGNGLYGIEIEGGATANLVQGNKIGTDAAGTAAVANGQSGVGIFGSQNTVGGAAAGAGNLISGNTRNGILVFNNATANLVQGNKIGTNAAGTAALANTLDGVDILSSSNTVGGTAAGAGNLISGNGSYGIQIEGGTTATRVQGNKIGTNAAGTAAVANGSAGITIDGSNNTVGGTAAGAGNLISGNSLDGILIKDQPAGAPSTANLVQGNKIGTNAAGTAALPNGASGVHIIQSSNNTIGGTTAGAANTIAFNKADGVFVESGTGNAIRQNSIFANGSLGNRLGPGANNNQPAPSLTSARYDPFFTHVLTARGTVTGVAGSQVTLEFFASPAGDPEGKVYLGSLVVTIGANGTASFTFTLTTNKVSPGMVITATATDPTNGTSQFSAGRTV
jgi:titin